MTRLVYIVVHRSSHFLLEHSCDSDNPTSAGSTFHSLEVLGKKKNLGAFLELKGIWNSYDCMTVPSSCFLGELQQRPLDSKMSTTTSTRFSQY